MHWMPLLLCKRLLQLAGLKAFASTRATTQCEHSKPMCLSIVSLHCRAGIKMVQDRKQPIRGTYY